MQRRRTQSKGQTLVEYALIIVFISLAVFAALTLMGDRLEEFYTTFTNAIP